MPLADSAASSKAIEILGFQLEPGDYSNIIWLFVAYMVFRVVMPVIDAWKNRTVNRMKAVDKEKKDAAEKEKLDVENSARTAADKEIQEYRMVNAETQRQILLLLTELRDEMVANRTPGVRSRQEALDFFIDYQDKNHIRIMCMLLTRIIENHIGTEPDTIADKWTELAEKLSGKTVSHFKNITHRGRQISDFWAGNGAKQYYLYICSELYALQVTNYEDAKPINRDRVERSLALNLSRLVTEFAVYLDTGVAFLEQWDDTKPMYSINKPFNLDQDIVINRHP